MLGLRDAESGVAAVDVILGGTGVWGSVKLGTGRAWASSEVATMLLASISAISQSLSKISRRCALISTASPHTRAKRAHHLSAPRREQRRTISYVKTNETQPPAMGRQQLAYERSQGSGSVAVVPFSRISKCRCAPKERPVLPVRPMYSPRLTVSPTSTWRESYSMCA